jgi:hypothetical protein
MRVRRLQRPRTEKGTKAQRPPAAQRRPGDTYFAEDENGGTLYMVGPTGTWVQQAPGVNQFGGRELVRSVLAAQQAGIGAAVTDLGGMVANFTVGARPVMVEAMLPIVSNNTANGNCLVAIADSANAEKARAMNGNPVAAAGFSVGPAREFIDVPGDYTRKARATNGAGPGTVTVYLAANIQPHIRVVEL